MDTRLTPAAAPLARPADPSADAALRAHIRRELHAIRPRALPATWGDAARFRQDLGLDSLDLVELVARLEQATGLYVPDDDVARLSSVAATLAYVRERRAAAAGD